MESTTVEILMQFETTSSKLAVSNLQQQKFLFSWKQDCLGFLNRNLQQQKFLFSWKLHNYIYRVMYLQQQKFLFSWKHLCAPMYRRYLQQQKFLFSWKLTPESSSRSIYNSRNFYSVGNEIETCGGFLSTTVEIFIQLETSLII